jgi:hypothetical protein
VASEVEVSFHVYWPFDIFCSVPIQGGCPLLYSTSGSFLLIYEFYIDIDYRCKLFLVIVYFM